VLIVEFIRLGDESYDKTITVWTPTHYARPDRPLNAFETSSSCSACTFSPIQYSLSPLS
jgi:hypothetical protein